MAGWTSQEAWRGRPVKILIQITAQFLHNYKLTAKLKAIRELWENVHVTYHLGSQ